MSLKIEMIRGDKQVTINRVLSTINVIPTCQIVSFIVCSIRLIGKFECRVAMETTNLGSDPKRRFSYELTHG